MSTIQVQSDQQTDTAGQIINDFSFTVATPNGSGSQTSNLVLIRALFKMGIPVNGKNLFPSNIKGLPTWYTIRVSKDGYIARRDKTQIVIAFNEKTAADDINSIPTGGVCILPQEWRQGRVRIQLPERDDIIFYEVPVKELIKAFDIPSQRREQVSNMVYVGAVAQLFGIDIDLIKQALSDQFGGKERPVQMNMQVIEAAYNWVAENVEKRDPYRFAPLNMTEGKILITGNESAALGAIFGGVTVTAWYPITPSTSVVDSVLKYRYLRKDPETGKSTVAVVQAEDELAAIGMVVGAGWAGARAMTATSGPGISLMAEFAGLAYFAEIPSVIWDITRMGPSTGLPTRTSQGDLLFAHTLGHGDTQHPVLLPSSVEEAFEFGWRAFDLADELQTLVFVLSDLDLGMNLWMSEPFTYPDEPIKRGKVLNAEDLEAFEERFGVAWGRHRDVDGDGIAYRTLPGTDHPKAAYFTRGTGHNEMAVYSERPDDWVQNLDRLHRKMETAKKLMPKPVVEKADGAKIGIISFGTNDAAIREARDWLAAEGVATDYMRVRSLPLQDEVHEFMQAYDRVYVIENNFDGQLLQVIRMYSDYSTKHVRSLALGDSLPMTPDWVYAQITEQERK